MEAGLTALRPVHYAVPSAEDADGNELVAVRGVLASLLGDDPQWRDILPWPLNTSLNPSATNCGWDTKPAQVFRASCWRTFTTVWPVIEFEADDALPSAAAVATWNKGGKQAIICTLDKDLPQCVTDTRVVQLSRRPH